MDSKRGRGCGPPDRFLTRSVYEHHAKSLSEKWVEQATRLFRSATRRPEGRDARIGKARAHWLVAFFPFRPASRRTAQASGLCHPHLNFQTGS